MRITIQRSGGMGGMRVGGTIETDELGGDLAGRAADLLQPERLASAAAARSAPGAADMHQYEVTLASGATFGVSGEAGAPEVVAVLDELVNEILRRQRG